MKAEEAAVVVDEKSAKGIVKVNRNQSENGVDISDTTRRYEKEKWPRIRCDTQQRILKDTAR